MSDSHPLQVATKDKVLIVRPSVTLDLNTNARDLRAFNKFKTAKVRAAAAQLDCVDARLSFEYATHRRKLGTRQRCDCTGLMSAGRPQASTAC